MSLYLDLWTFAPALVAGALVIATHVPLGREVLRSGIVFLDLAIAQAAGLGVILAGTGAANGVVVQLSAAVAALSAALLLTWAERRASRLQEALIGSLFVVTACLGLIVLSANPHGGEHLRDLLVGQILWVGWADLAPVACLYAAILLVWFTLGPSLGRVGFYALFALSVTASVQLVGIYLVFGTLILPALAVAGLPPPAGLLRAYAIAAGGYAIGFGITATLDMPTGPTIVCCLATLAAARYLILAGSTRSSARRAGPLTGR